MKGEVKLYIGGVPVELSKDIDILFTYSVDELTNPTIIRNSYSKTITIEDTPENSKLFGQFWNAQRIQTIDGEYGTSFDPSKRVPFTVYVNGEIYQEGYAKLLNVKTTGKNSTYEVSLFGGLGSFFYNLSYHGDDNEGDNKKKLSDLHFMTWDTATPSEREFDFVAKKETLKEAWDNVQASVSSKWHYINFADCYDGLPDDFDADKVLVNLPNDPAPSSGGTPSRRPGGRTTNNPFIVTSSTTDGSYASYDGYILAELPKERTAQEMREFRSYLMRPVVRVKEIINACCNPVNNGGYEVELDNTFFNQNNPYWEDAWMTLPLLTSMDFGGNEGDDQSGVTVNIGSTTSGGTRTGDIYKETTVFTLGTITANTGFNIAMDLDIYAIMNALPYNYKTTNTDWVYDHSVTGGIYMSPESIFPCAYSTKSNTYYPGAIEVQLVAYSRDGKVITGSEVFNCTSGYNPHRTSQGGRGGATTVSTYVPSPNDFSAYTPDFETTYTTKSGQFDYVSGSSSSNSTWKMKDRLSFVLKKLPKTCTIKLIVSKVNQSSMTINNRAMAMFQRYYSDYTTDSQGYLNSAYSTYYRAPATVNHFTYEISNVMVSLNETEEAIRTGAKFTKADLLNTDYTPADFFLSYGKLFGLYFEKDPYEDKVYVRTRNTFYRKNNVHDISDKIDRSKTSQLTPIVFDAKWYTWQLDSDSSLFGEQYKATYGREYGIQRVNTGYNFDSSEKKLYDGNVFKGGIEALEKSDMYGYVSADTIWKPWMFDGFTYNLYNVNDMEDTTEIEMPTLVKKGSIISYSGYKYCDLFSKMQFHTDDNSASDGANVLVFFNGSVPCTTWNNNTELNYWITDDNSYMNTLNDGKPCWLYTTTATDKGGSDIAIKVTSIPQFSRYLTLQNPDNIKQTWDFGYPMQLFVPNYNMDYASTLYTNYWQSYIKDMYDVNTKKMTCWVKFDRRPMAEWLRDFFWYDNSIWRINKIEDYNVVSEDSTKVEFIKVQDMDAYGNVDVSSIPSISISASTPTIGNAGATVTIYVNVSDGGDWFVSDYVCDTYNASVSSGHGNGSFTIQIPANTTNETKVHRISVENGYDQWGWCEIVQGNVVFEIVHVANYIHQDVPWTGNTDMPCQYLVKSTYPWSVTADRNYVSISPSSGPASTAGTSFELVFDPSDSLAPRNVKLTFTDTQGNVQEVWKWQTACGGLIFAASGETKTLELLSGYTGVTPDWITVVDNGDDTYSVTADPNPEMEPRNVTLFFTSPTANSTTIAVFQYAPVIFEVKRVDGTGSVLSAGGDITLDVTANGEWTITDHSAWCTPSVASGSTSATFTVTISQNGDEARKGTIVFQHVGGSYITYEVTQNGTNTDNFVDPTALMFDATGGTKVFNVNTTDEWQIVGNPSWTTVSPTGGTGSTAVTVTVPASLDWERSGSIVVWNVDKNKTYVVSVQQATGDVFKVTRVNGSGDIPAAGGSSNICYLEVTSPNHSWTATTTDSFITFTPTGHTASTGVYVTFSENTGGNRTATLTFNNGVTSITYTQTQAGYGQASLVVPNALIFSASGGTAETQTVTVNIPNNWQIVGYPSWVTATPSSGTTRGVTVSVTAIPYSGDVQRQGSLVFADMTTNQVSIVTCIQNPGEGEILAVSPSRLVFNQNGGTAQLTIIANTDWTIG